MPIHSSSLNSAAKHSQFRAWNSLLHRPDSGEYNAPGLGLFRYFSARKTAACVRPKLRSLAVDKSRMDWTPKTHPVYIDDRLTDERSMRDDTFPVNERQNHHFQALSTLASSQNI